MSEPRKSLREIADHAWMDLELGRHAIAGGTDALVNFEFATNSIMALLGVGEDEALRLIREMTDRDAFNLYVEGMRARLIPQE